MTLFRLPRSGTPQPSPLSIEGGTTVLLLGLDLAGTFLFSVEGARAAVAANLDALGILVLGFCTALGGGIIRDLLIGDVPPPAIRDWRYPVAAFAGGTLVFCLHGVVDTVPAFLLTSLDAAALSLFAVAGTVKALSRGLSLLIATLLGTITGVGGGAMRDVMLAHIPAVLRVDVYAGAAWIGSAMVVISRRLGLPPPAAAMLGGSVCFGIRMISYSQHWNLPRAL